MKQYGRWRGWLAWFSALLAAQQAWGADIIVTGSVVQVAETPRLMARPKAPLDPAYLSAKDEILLSVCNLPSPDAIWRVDVRRDSSEWPAGMKLEVRRTGDGIGEGAITGRRGFTEVGRTYRTLCSGTGDRMNIPLQIRISGYPLDLDVGTHVTGIIYTVMQIGR